MGITNTQLPAELEAEIREKAKGYAQSFGRSEFGYYALNWEAGATAYAVKLHETQKEIERLKQWKSEASTVLDPILNYGQSKEANIPIGKSITSAVLERCKRYDQARQLLKKIVDLYDLSPEDELYNQIKPFLDGK